MGAFDHGSYPGRACSKVGARRIGPPSIAAAAPVPAVPYLWCHAAINWNFGPTPSKRSYYCSPAPPNPLFSSETGVVWFIGSRDTPCLPWDSCTPVEGDSLALRVQSLLWWHMVPLPPPPTLPPRYWGYMVHIGAFDTPFLQLDSYMSEEGGAGR